MKKMFILALMSVVCLVSCRQGVIEIPEDNKGTLSLNVTNLTDYITVETKADGDEDGSSVIDYTNTADYDVVVDGPTPLKMKYSEFSGKVIELGSGSYNITVTSPATEPAAFEQPIYQAQAAFEIKAGEVTPLDLTCTPANCKVTIELSENFKKELAMYEVTVGNGLGKLTWVKNSEVDDFGKNKTGYFLPRGLEIKVKGFRSIDNTEATAVYYIKEVNAAEHHVVKLDAKVTGQIGGIQIDVVTTFTEKSQDVVVEGMDETYVDRPDFGDDDGSEDEEDMSPVIIWPENAFFDPITLGACEVKMTVKAPRGFQTFKVEPDADFKESITVLTNTAYVCEVDENGEIVFVQDGTDAEGNPVMVTVKKNFGTEESPIYKTLPHVDWDNDGVVPEEVDYIDLINHSYFWYSFGLPVGNQIENKQEFDFDLTPFMTALKTVASGMTVSFTLKATDVEGEFVMYETMDGDKDIPVVTITVPAN